MDNLIDIDIIILNKLAAWNEVDHVWHKYYDLDVETKSFIQLFKHVPQLEKFYNKLSRFDNEKIRNHHALIQILKETSQYLTGAMSVFSGNGDEYIFKGENLSGPLYQ